MENEQKIKSLGSAMTSADVLHGKDSNEADTVKADVFGNYILREDLAKYETAADFEYNLSKAQSDALIANSRADIASTFHFTGKILSMEKKLKYRLDVVIILLVLVIIMMGFLVLRT